MQEPHGQWVYRGMGKGLKGAMATYARYGDVTFGALSPRFEGIPNTCPICFDREEYLLASHFGHGHDTTSEAPKAQNGHQPQTMSHPPSQDWVMPPPVSQPADWDVASRIPDFKALSPLIQEKGIKILPAEKSILGYNKDFRTTFVIYVDDHFMTGWDFWSMFAFLQEQYFPRVILGHIPLAGNKMTLFDSKIPTFKRWDELWTKKSSTSWDEVLQLVYLTPFLRRHIPGQADLVRTLKKAFFEEIGFTTPKGKKSVQTKWVEKVTSSWGPEQAEAIHRICTSVQERDLWDHLFETFSHRL
ncbi:hypothetical protein B0H66DRAFT_607654 [Apodospora peruviana]|uniref:Uncharacterized protein n=1 Tax=Apodospora peruviana TaxID=516989 RepID=A0AAE0HTH5_9PEZI|nr:hypothetical protein B0H66DRAFT_607654 [Apodospora peruviana]